MLIDVILFEFRRSAILIVVQVVYMEMKLEPKGS